jgi:glycosyltransferase involved in cell wall biosynthesis
MTKIQPLFDFIKYIQPAWYFNLLTDLQIVWTDYFKLAPKDQEIVQWDPGYASEWGSKCDAAYQALQKGILTDHPRTKLNNISSTELTIYDNYRFIRKYYHYFWSIHILLIRLITLHNPLRELSAFIKAFSVKRVNVFNQPKEYPEFLSFYSSLEMKEPLVSIIIPTLNRYSYLKDALSDLEKQNYKNFEVLIADQSEPYREEFYQGWKIKLSVIRQKEKALWLARNQCIQKASGDFILLFDDDSRVDPDWIKQHLRCLDFFLADLSSGVSFSLVGSKVPENYSFFRLSDQLDTGNVMIRRKVFEKAGLFDRQFEKQRMGDGEFGLRCYLSEFRNISNPHASRLHLKVKEGGLRQMGSWDAFRPKKIYKPRPIPSVLYYIRKYFGNNAAKWALVQNIPPSIVPYRFKGKKITYIFGPLLSFALLPVLLYQVSISWNKSSKMLRDGEKIPKLYPKEKGVGYIV